MNTNKITVYLKVSKMTHMAKVKGFQATKINEQQKLG